MSHTQDTNTASAEEPDEDQPTLRQRANAERKFQRLRESDNPFAEKAVELYDEEDKDFDELVDLAREVETALGDASIALVSFLARDWKVTVKVPADDTPSGYRYETYVRGGETKEEAERRVRDYTGHEVVSEKTEFHEYVRVS